MTNLSRRELSLWGSLLITLMATVYYFVTLVGMVTDAGGVPAGRVVLLWIVTVGLVIVAEVGFEISLAVITRDEPADERDRLIAARASRVAYAVLFGGAMLAVAHIAMGSIATRVEGLVLFGPFMSANLVVLVLNLSEIARWSSQLWLYRRGV